MIRRYFIEIVVFLFILLFTYAAVTKLLDYDRFVIQVKQSPVLAGVGNWVPPMVIASELLLVMMLMIEPLRRVALYGALSIMTMFTTYIVIILNFSVHIPCSCGGIIEMMGWKRHLVFNIVFIIASVMVIVIMRGDSHLKHNKFVL